MVVRSTEYVFEWNTSKPLQEPLSNPEFQDKLRKALESNNFEFSVDTLTGNKEKYTIEVLDDVSDFINHPNNTAIFHMFTQNNCVRLKH